MMTKSVMEDSELSAVSLKTLRPVELFPLPARPAVSVLITCFNYGPYVGEAIESVLRQTYEVSEIVVSDDGSSDNSCEVVEGYASRDGRVKLVRGAHGGMAACLNGAYAASSGDVVCLLDADDVFLPDKVEAVVEAFRDNRDAGFCTHRALLMDHKARRRGVYPLGSLPVGDCAFSTFSNAGILMGLPPTTNLSLRREVAERLFPISAELTGYAEQMIHRLAPLMTELCSANAALAEWRQHGKNDQKATHLTLKRLDRELEIMMLLWEKQRDYLASVNPEAAGAFPGLDRSAYFRKLRYAQARLAGSADASQRYSELFASPLDGGKDIYFWQLSKFLPQPIFSKALDLVMTQGVLKELIARFTRQGHSAP
jgi:glycosyltransferase involved in cell wall biosynthesis